MPYLFARVTVLLRISMSVEPDIRLNERSSERVTWKPSITTHERPDSRNALARRPTNVCCWPGFPPPRFTYRPCPLTWRNVFTGSDDTLALDTVSRVPFT